MAGGWFTHLFRLPTSERNCAAALTHAACLPLPPFLHLQIHTSKMTTNSFLGRDVDLAELAARTKNFSGAEIEGLVKSATSFALNRQVGVHVRLHGGSRCIGAC